jgi:hypothetical protein
VPTKIRLHSGGQPFSVQESIDELVTSLNQAAPDEWLVVTREAGGGKKVALIVRDVVDIEEA